DSIGRPLVLGVVKIGEFANRLQSEGRDAIGALDKLLALSMQLFAVADSLARGTAIRSAFNVAGEACRQTAALLRTAVDAFGIPDKIGGPAKRLQQVMHTLDDLERQLRTNLPTGADISTVLNTVTRLRVGVGSGIQRLSKTLVDALAARDQVASAGADYAAE